MTKILMLIGFIFSLGHTSWACKKVDTINENVTWGDIKAHYRCVKDNLPVYKESCSTAWPKANQAGDFFILCGPNQKSYLAITRAESDMISLASETADIPGYQIYNALLAHQEMLESVPGVKQVFIDNARNNRHIWRNQVRVMKWLKYLSTFSWYQARVPNPNHDSTLHTLGSVRAIKSLVKLLSKHHNSETELLLILDSATSSIQSPKHSKASQVARGEVRELISMGSRLQSPQETSSKTRPAFSFDRSNRSSSQGNTKGEFVNLGIPTELFNYRDTNKQISKKYHKYLCELFGLSLSGKRDGC